MTNDKVIFESGATSHAVNDLILFTDNTRQTVQLRDEIYSDWQTTGNFGTRPHYERFWPLLASAKRHYINEFKNSGAGHILRMTNGEIMEYLKIYVDGFKEWKDEHK